MPHQPVTAVTRVSEAFSGETVGSPVVPNSPGGQQSDAHNEAVSKTLIQSGKIVDDLNKIIPICASLAMQRYLLVLCTL